MLRERVWLGIWLGVSMTALGCGGGTATDNAFDILTDFRTKELGAARQEYKGKSFRLWVEKVQKIDEHQGKVLVQGQTGKIIISAAISDAAEKPKALALKKGGPAIFEGEVIDATSTVPAMGLIILDKAKVVP